MILTLTRFADALGIPEVRDYLKRTVRAKVGISVRPVHRSDGGFAVIDQFADQVVAEFSATKHEIADQVVRDLLAVYIISRWLRSFLEVEPVWSPYP